MTSELIDPFDDPNYQIRGALQFQQPAIEAAPFLSSEIAREALGAVRDVATEGLLILTAVLVIAAYGRIAGGMARAVIHRAGATMIGIVGFGFALFLAVLIVMAIMDGRQGGANVPTLVGGTTAATCLALAGWNVLCGVGGAWRTRWAVTGFVLSVIAGGVGYVENRIRTAAASEAQAASEIRLAQARQLLTNEIVIHTPNGNTIHFPAGTSPAEMRRAVEGLDRAVQQGVPILEGDEIPAAE
jgi:hypothetical protein